MDSCVDNHCNCINPSSDDDDEDDDYYVNGDVMSARQVMARTRIQRWRDDGYCECEDKVLITLSMIFAPIPVVDHSKWSLMINAYDYDLEEFGKNIPTVCESLDGKLSWEKFNQVRQYF